MDPINLLSTKITTLSNLQSALVSKHGDTFSRCSTIIGDALKNGNTIFWCGNGGSAAESSHLAVELIGRFKNK